jgi:hypothetical protein
VPEDVTHDDEFSVIEVLATMLAMVQPALTPVDSTGIPTPILEVSAMPGDRGIARGARAILRPRDLGEVGWIAGARERAPITGNLQAAVAAEKSKTGLPTAAISIGTPLARVYCVTSQLPEPRWVTMARSFAAVVRS